MIWDKIKNSFQGTKYEGINKSFVKKAKVNGFFATNINDSNFVFYDPEFYSQFQNLANIDISYIIKFSLAHEIGHIVNEDVLTHKHSKENEAEADLFACKVLCGLNDATKEGIKNVLFTLVGPSQDNLYPNKGECIKSIDSFFLKNLCNYNIENNSIRVRNRIWDLNNLNTSYYQNGDMIQKAENNSQWMNYCKKKIGCWCYYEFDMKNEVKYGKLYNWYTV